ncbi:MAG: GNAT family N-acetyltransferase [Kofleriaceae bacterium]|nr:GNAT family N-acetyltransferase [Kofleriaceae bacterium]
MFAPSIASARFAIRSASIDDASAIARVQIESWQTSYRGILPDSILDTMDVAHRTAMRRAMLRDATALNLVAYDTTHGDIVGYCNAGPSRRSGRHIGELYEIYLVDRAKRYGLGRELFEQVTDWCRDHQRSALVVWVLENNHHARRFYEAMGGRPGGRMRSMVRGFGVIEQAYVYTLQSPLTR